jgi:hypothetical protein
MAMPAESGGNYEAYADAYSPLVSARDKHPPHVTVPEGDRFPRFVLLGFSKP